MSPAEHSKTIGSGTLYVVATPIGNLGDLSTRAREVLANVRIIAAEDTRHTGTLLQTLGIKTPQVSLHEHNETERIAGVVERLRRGEAVALVSDAGTPLISDPGFALVRAVREAGMKVVPIPGPNAAIAALSVAGLPADRYVFEGFLPPKAAARRAHLATLEAEQRTMIFYEAPHRLAETLHDLVAVMGPLRRAVIARELTKRYETLYAGTLAELRDQLHSDPSMTRGELVLLLSGADRSGAPAVGAEATQVLRTLLEELPAGQASKLAARLTGVKRADLYELAVRWSGGPDDPAS